MENNWYAIHSHPHKEELLWDQLLSRGFDAFYPRIRVRVVNPRARKIRPYFPGYLFVRVNIEEAGISTFQWMPYATGLVSFGGEPAAVPENLINEMKKRFGDVASAVDGFLEGLKPGTPVMISSGPFAGYEAIFDTRISGSERVRVLLQMLGSRRRVPLEINAGMIQKKTRGNF